MGKDQELLEAARNGNIAVVEKILGQRAKRSGPLASLRRGPGANVQDASGYSALHHAALNGHKEVVEMLLSHEASPNILDAKGCSPLHLAAWTGNVAIVRLLLCHGPSVTNVNLLNQNKETALHCAAQYGHTEVVNLLLEYGCDPTIRNNKQETPLDLAAQYGRLETVEGLVRTHPELITEYSGNVSLPHTPLHLASRNGHKGVVEVLLSAGMEVNARTSAGTALHEAALCGKLEVVKLLLDSGVRLSIRDAGNNTVYDLLQQFPAHVVQHITALISRQRQCEDVDDELPPIPVLPCLGSPYENVRRAGSPSSPNWLDYRRVSAASISSDGRRGMWNNKNVDGSLVSEDSCCSRDVDQMSVSSGSSLGCTARDIYLPMTPSPGSKLPPTPPKKPPRRNLSVSPTHLTPEPYEYLFLAKSGGGAESRRENLRRGKSADQYVDMRLQPIAITSLYENVPFRTTNPKRKLRRVQTERGSEGPDPAAILARGDLPFKRVEPRSPVGVERLRIIDLKSDSEDGGPRINGDAYPLSPTNYQQPPTPDHPPPSALQAENSIHERIRPLSQEYMKRRSRDMETETDEELLLLVYPSPIQEPHEYISNIPFAGLNLSGSKSSTPVTSSIGQWLETLELQQYEDAFVRQGYDNIHFIKGVLEEEELKEMGLSEEERSKVMEAVTSLEERVSLAWADGEGGVEGWLSRLDLSNYWETFKKHFYADLERIRKVWEVELSTVLEISTPGHRRRMIASLPDRSHQPQITDLNLDLMTPAVGQEKEKGPQTTSTGTLRHSHKKCRPPPPPPELHIRQPSEILSGPTVAKHWKHSASALLTDNVSYHAQYLGSTLVKELRGTESTQKSIQRLKSAEKPSTDVYLVISYKGVKFLDPATKDLVCEHEIRNIHCACQDSEDLSHFAYITKDFSSNAHYCHVFSVETMDLASEVILTLGQAFEVAYQVALRDEAAVAARRLSTGNPLSLGGGDQFKSPSTATQPNGPATPSHHLTIAQNI